MKLNKTLFFCILSVIIGIVFFQRTYKITQNPPALFSDEVDAGYQAVCFNRHLTDYHGNFLPTSFHSFSDWRTPLYIYSIAALLKLHLPTDLSVRLPAAIFGILSIFVFSLILYQLWSKKIPIFLLSFFLASVSPWLFHYSRSGFEVTGMLFCLLTAILFLVIFYKHTKPLYLLFSGLFFISSIYFYSTSKLYIALIAPLIFILFYKKIFSLKLSQLALISFLCLVFLFPYIKDSLNGTAGYRFSYINIFSDPTVADTVNYYRQQDAVAQNGLIIGLKTTASSAFFHSKPEIWFTSFIRNYLSSFSSEFLFLKGDANLRHNIGALGELLYPDFIFVLLGIVYGFHLYLSSSKQDLRQKFFLFFLISLLLSPIPYALTRDSLSPHSTRLILMLPSLLYFSVLGIDLLLKACRKYYYFGLVSVLAVYLLSFFTYYHFYNNHYPYISARNWHVNMAESVIFSQSVPASKTYFSNKFEPFLPFFLYYTKYHDPQYDCQVAKSFVWDNNSYFTGMQAQHKYYFGNINWSGLFSDKKFDFNQTIFVIPEQELQSIKSSLVNSSLSLQQIKVISRPELDAENFYIVKFLNNDKSI